MNPLIQLRCILLPAVCASAVALISGCDSSAASSPRIAALPATAPQRPSPPAIRQIPAAREPAADAAITNVFAATSWQPAAPPPPAPSTAPATAAVMPAPPVAPPLPFRFLGRYGDGDSLIVMLVKGEQLYLVSAGDTIDDAYRVDRVSATMVELTYLPLNLKQSLSTGDAG
jgi:hypothetical protein